MLKTLNKIISENIDNLMKIQRLIMNLNALILYNYKILNKVQFKSKWQGINILIYLKMINVQNQAKEMRSKSSKGNEV